MFEMGSEVILVSATAQVILRRGWGWFQVEMKSQQKGARVMQRLALGLLHLIRNIQHHTNPAACKYSRCKPPKRHVDQHSCKDKLQARVNCTCSFSSELP